MVDWRGFSNIVKMVVAQEEKQWNPVHKRLMSWIGVEQLYNAF